MRSRFNNIIAKCLLVCLFASAVMAGSHLPAAKADPGLEVTANNTVELAAYLANPAVATINLNGSATYELDGTKIERNLTIKGNGATIQARNPLNDKIIRTDDNTIGPFNGVSVFLAVYNDFKLENVTLKGDSDPGNAEENHFIFAAIAVKDGGSLSLDTVIFSGFYNNDDSPGGDARSYGIFAEPGATATTVKRSSFGGSNAFRAAIAISGGTTLIDNNTFVGTDYPNRLEADDGYEYGIYLYGGTGTVKNNTISGFDSTHQDGYTSSGIATIAFMAADYAIYGNTLQGNGAGLDMQGTWTAYYPTPRPMKLRSSDSDPGLLLDSTNNAVTIGEALKAANTFTGNLLYNVSAIVDQSYEVLLSNLDQINGNSSVYTPLGGYKSPFLSVTGVHANDATLLLPWNESTDYYDKRNLLVKATSVTIERQSDGQLLPVTTGTYSYPLTGLTTDSISRYRLKMTHDSDEIVNSVPVSVTTYSQWVTVNTNIAPDVPIIATPANNSSYEDTFPTFTGTAEAGSTVIVRIDGVDHEVPANDLGQWTYTPTYLGYYGSHTVQVTARDAAGNVSAAATLTFAYQNSYVPTASSSPAPAPSTTPKPTRQVNVEVGPDGHSTNAAKVDITRMAGKDGTQTDTVQLGKAKVDEAAGKAQQDGKSTVRVVIDELPSSLADEQIVSLDKEAYAALAGKKLDLEIQTEQVTVKVPASSLDDWSSNDDLFFRLVPVRSSEDRSVAEQRTLSAELVQQSADGRNVQLVGTPMTIETNLQNRPVALRFPINASAVPSGAAERASFLAGLAVYIEHSDGDKALERGTIVYDAQGNPVAIEIGVDKFSTFTIVSIAPEKLTHRPYINGYDDGKFRPEQPVSRAELAAMLDRLQPGAATGGAAAFPDVPSAYWGAAAIAHVQAAGLMTGDPDGAFRPADNVTRAELAVIAGRLQPQKASAGASGGSAAAPDDAAGHWAEAVIAQAVASGSLPALPDGTFRPDRPVTRAEAVTALNRLYGRGPLSGVKPPFADVPASSDAAAAIAEAAVAHDAFRQADGSETAVN